MLYNKIKNFDMVVNDTLRQIAVVNEHVDSVRVDLECKAPERLGIRQAHAALAKVSIIELQKLFEETLSQLDKRIKELHHERK